MIQRSRFCSMPERTAKSQEQMSKSCWVSAQPVLHDAFGTWLRVNSSGRSEKQEISDTPYMTHSIIESPQRDHETRKSHSELRPPQSTVGYFYVQGQCLRPPHHRSAGAQQCAEVRAPAPPGSRWRFILNTDPGQF